MNEKFINSLYFTFGLYSLVLVLVGTPLNIFCFYIFKRIIPNRSNSTIIVFSYLAIIEVLVPFTWNLNYVIRELWFKQQKHQHIKNLEQYSLVICKLISYGAYCILQCAAWLKSLATLTRCVSVHHDWSIRKYVSRPNVIHPLTLIIICVIGLINFPILIVEAEENVFVTSLNQTVTQIKCYKSKLFAFWEIAHMMLYNFVPFTIMILCNLSIINHVHQSQRRTKRSKVRSPSMVKSSSSSGRFSANRRSFSNSGTRLTKTLIFVTIFFIIFTSPSAIFYIFLAKIFKKHRNLITMALSNLATTSHVTSFFIYWMTSTDFRDAAMGIFSFRVSEDQRHSIEEKQQENIVALVTMQSSTDNRRKMELQKSSIPPSFSE